MHKTYKLFNESAGRANPYQLALHDLFEGRFSGDTKADIPARMFREPALAIMDARDFAEQVVHFYNYHNPLGKRLDPQEVFILGHPKEDPKVIRLEVLPLKEDERAAFYVATKQRNHRLNEVEVGHLRSSQGYQTVGRVCKDIEVMISELVRMQEFQGLKPSYLIASTPSHPINHSHPERHETAKNIYKNRVISEFSDPKGGPSTETHKVVTQGLLGYVQVGGIQQEFLDAYSQVTGHLPLGGLRRSDSATAHKLALYPQANKGPVMTLSITAQGPREEISLEHQTASDHTEKAREIVRRTLSPLVLVIDRLRD